jgi:hypothetical protein
VATGAESLQLTLPRSLIESYSAFFRRPKETTGGEREAEEILRTRYTLPTLCACDIGIYGARNADGIHSCSLVVRFATTVNITNRIENGRTGDWKQTPG